MEKKKIFVIGGDGFCGWPLSLRLSNLNYNVVILDNLSRRKIDIELGSSSLTPIASIEDRILTWEKIQNKKIKFEYIDVAKEYDRLKQIFINEKPNIVIHLGEQRAAPYSMKNEHTRNYTVNNNLNSTHNLLNVITEVDKNIHFIHLGTMGVYGYGTIDNVTIPEGYVTVKMKNNDEEYKDVEILHPSYPGSIYHLTKTQDALFFQFYTKNYGIKITDLHQGIIWGIGTKETSMHPNLINRFDYDSDYGTVLNRFIMQSVHNIPLTIYGTGEQTRAFIHIDNFMDCVCLAIDNPPKSNKVEILNQQTETHCLNNLSQLIKEIYPNTTINYISNPRKELIKNSLDVSHQKFLNLGLNPVLLSSERIIEIYDLISKYKQNVDMKHILPKSFW